MYTTIIQKQLIPDKKQDNKPDRQTMNKPINSLAEYLVQENLYILSVISSNAKQMGTIRQLPV